MRAFAKRERRKDGKATAVAMSDIKVEPRSFSVFQASMDLPPDKAKLLKQYDNEKKWDIICDQVSIQRA